MNDDTGFILTNILLWLGFLIMAIATGTNDCSLTILGAIIFNIGIAYHIYKDEAIGG